MLAVASPAMAKGGGGGGGGGANAACATFSSYAVTPTSFDATRASINVDYAVAYSCFDESWPPLSFTIKNESTGQSGTSVYFGPILPGLHTQVFAAAYGTKYTITTSLTQASNGAIWDTRKNTVTTPTAP
jgi:hypothetical protein